MSLQLQTLTVNHNEKKQAYLTVSGCDVQLPAVVINGASSGKTILLTAGIHGAEYTGIQTLVELSNEIRPEDLKGALIIIPIANPTGFRSISPWTVPDDGKNLNRMFPGDENGSLSQKLAHTISQLLQSNVDFYVDLHAGDLYEQLTPYVYYPGAAAQNIVSAAREAALILSVPYRVRSSASSGAYNSAAILGIPSLLIERGGNGQWSRQEVDNYKADIYRLLSHLGLTFTNPPSENILQKELVAAFYPTAEVDGLWYPSVTAGQCIQKNDLLGEIRDCFGNTLQTCFAKETSIVLYRTTSLSIRKGDPTVAYGACVT